MRELTYNDVQAVSGGNAAGVLGATAGAAGALYGAAWGASIATPLATIGIIFALTSSSIIWEGIYFCVGLVAVGTLGGAVIGGTLGAGVGTGAGYLIDKANN